MYVEQSTGTVVIPHITEQERGSPQVNGWSVLMKAKVIGSFLFVRNCGYW
jgi:hypothetical protein